MQTAQGLLDIEPPLVPAGTGLNTVLIAMALILLLMILATLAFRHFSSFRSQARRRLRHLQRSVAKQLLRNDSKGNETVTRVAAYQLARHLADGVGINGITSSTALPAELSHQQDRWQSFTRELSAVRFDRQYSQQSNLDELFSETFFWLKNWP